MDGLLQVSISWSRPSKSAESRSSLRLLPGRGVGTYVGTVTFGEVTYGVRLHLHPDQGLPCPYVMTKMIYYALSVCVLNLLKIYTNLRAPQKHTSLYINYSLYINSDLMGHIG